MAKKKAITYKEKHMSLENVNIEMEKQEKETYQLLISAIAHKANFIFEAGAGAGKTYALKQSIDYVLNNFSKNLQKNNQKILCITYTNSAAQEIKARIGNTSLVEIATIHEKFWTLIGSQQSALRFFHKIKIQEQIEIAQKKFEREAGCYDWLHAQKNEDLKSDFLKFLQTKETKDRFYQAQLNGNISEAFTNDLNHYGYTLNRNKTKLEMTFRYINKIADLEYGLQKLKYDKKIRVTYNPDINSDKLHKMQISHDSLLEYAFRICSAHPKMIDLIVDSTPYIFIDEYQDTNINIIKTLQLIANHSTNTQRKCCIGYFGDTMQNIYSDGIGRGIENYSHGFIKIVKKENRRSYVEVINAYNKIRNDSISQISIYNDCEGGRYRYYQEEIEDNEETAIHSITQRIRQEFSLLDSDEITCLVMKNKTIATLSGFSSFYDILSPLFFYKDSARFILSNDIKKLHSIVRDIYKIVRFFTLLREKNNKLSYILPSKKNQTTWDEARKFTSILEKVMPLEKKSFKACITTAFEYTYLSNSLYKLSITEAFPFLKGNYDIELFKDYLIKSLNMTTKQPMPKIAFAVEGLLNIDMNELIDWYDYINNKNKYITCHNAKGLEFNNVIVFLTDEFANSKNYLSSLFEDPDNDKYQERRNLLYVALSRAIKNLAVVFLYQKQKPSDCVKNFLAVIDEKQ